MASKAEAFAAPAAIIDQDLTNDTGTIEPTPEEELLMDVYDGLGRSDLASAVKHGRKYYLINTLLGRNSWGSIVRSLYLSFGADVTTALPDNEDEWKTWEADWEKEMLKKYQGHEGLKKVMARIG